LVNPQGVFLLEEEPILRNLLVRSEHTKGRRKMKDLKTVIPKEVTR
jgi:hypothetical protein